MTTRQSIEELLKGGKKIQAIKEARRVTGYGLREAKDAVDFYCAQGFWRDEDLAQLGGDAPSPDEVTEVGSDLDADRLREIEGLARGGQKIHAIKNFRELTRVGLKEAKDAVEHFIANGEWSPSDVRGSVASGVREAPSVAVPPTQSWPALGDEIPPSIRSSLIQSLEQHTGGATLLRGVVRAKHIFHEGYLCLLPDALHFVADSYGGLRVDYSCPYSAITKAEVAEGFDGFELVLEAGIDSNRFQSISKPDATAVAEVIRAQQ